MASIAIKPTEGDLRQLSVVAREDAMLSETSVSSPSDPSIYGKDNAAFPLQIVLRRKWETAMYNAGAGQQ